MCGIIGFFNNRSRGYAERLPKAVGVLEHRGPDAKGYVTFNSGYDALGHTRLSIQDLSEAGAQPMRLRTRELDLTITFNGEIYNFIELRKEIDEYVTANSCDGAIKIWVGHSDTEVILKGFAIFGPKFISRLNGIYAIGIFDAIQSQLFIARDPFGVKPLYVVEDGDSVAFASEIKALRILGVNLGETDAIGASQYVTFLYTPGSRTMHANVRKFPPGCIQQFDRTKKFIARELESPSIFALPEIRNPEEAVEIVRSKLRESVRRQLISDVPVGAFLSGGVDSSAIVKLASEIISPRDLTCFTVVNDTTGMLRDGFEDDLRFARDVARTIGVPLVEVPTSQDMAAKIPWMLGQLDEPQADLAGLQTAGIAKAAREAGVKVLLSGAGGDDIFTGYRRHTSAKISSYFFCLPSWVRSSVANCSQVVSSNRPSSRRFRKLLSGVGTTLDDFLIRAFCWTDPDVVVRLLDPTAREELNKRVILQPLADHLAKQIRHDAVSRSLSLDQRFFLTDHNLNYVDKMSMAFGVEVRVPFLDLELCRAVSRFHPDLLQRGFRGKWILRRALEGVIPRGVLDRKKVGFGVPLYSWVRGELRPFIDEHTSRSAVRANYLFDFKAVEAFKQEVYMGKLDNAYALFAVACVQCWLTSQRMRSSQE